MARIKIEDLPVLEDLSSEEAKGILGGVLTPTLVAPTPLVPVATSLVPVATALVPIVTVAPLLPVPTVV